MVSRDILKKEIDFVQERYLIALYKIIRSFKTAEDFEGFEADHDDMVNRKKQWHQFIDKFAGSLADTPITRAPQGNFELREELL